MKSSSRGGGGGFPSGPSLTSSQKAARDRAEAAKARSEATRARGEASRARGDAARERGRAATEWQHADIEAGLAAGSRAQDRPQDAAREAAYAAQDLAAQRRDLAEAARDSARAGRDSARAGRDAARARRDSARARTAGLASAGLGGDWVLGGNDRWDSCAAAAVANSLLLATGKRVSDDDVMALHRAVAGSPQARASVWDVLDAVTPAALSPVRAVLTFRASSARPRADGPGRRRFCDAVQASQHFSAYGLILELALQQSQRDQSVWDFDPSPSWGLHAVLLADGFAVTWGRAVPVTQAFLEQQTVAAWAVEWRTGRSV